MCLNWIDVFLCQEVNIREKEAECAGRLPPVAKSSIQWRAYKELFLLYITALSSSGISRKDFHLLFSISLNHRTNQVGRDLWRSLIQHPARSKANRKGRWGCSRLCPVEVWPSLGWRVYHLWASVPVICFPPCVSSHRTLHQKPCWCQGNQRQLPYARLPSQSLGYRRQLDCWGTICPQYISAVPNHLLALHGHGNGFQEDSLHPSLPTDFFRQPGAMQAAGQGKCSLSSCVAVLFILTSEVQILSRASLCCQS